MTNVEVVKELYEQGWIVLPTLPGKKYPTNWKQYKTTPPTLDETLELFKKASKNHGYCVLTGLSRDKSKILVMLELESEAFVSKNVNKISQFMRQYNWPKNWIELSNSNGFHLFVELEAKSVENFELVKNMKLAMNSDGVVMCETRGEGGLSVISPSPKIGETGEGWRMDSATRTPAKISWVEYLRLLDLFASINEEYVDVYNDHKQQSTRKNNNTIVTQKIGSVEDAYVSVFDDFEQQTSWADILIPHGWQINSQANNEIFWTRPGKQLSDGVSATTGMKADRDRMFVFTTSTVLESETPLTKPYVYATLNFAGDMKRTYEYLKEQGFGQSKAKQSVNDSNVLEMLGQLQIADKFTEHAFDELKYDTSISRWFVYNDKNGCWEKDSKDNIRAMRKLKEFVLSHKNDEKMLKLSYQTMNSILKLSACNPLHNIRNEKFDVHNDLINTPDNVIDLRTGQVLSHDKKYFFTKTTNYSTTNNTGCERFEKFLGETFNDPEVLEYVQTHLGYCLTGETGENVLAFWLGTGRNGKSVFAELVLKIMGEYATPTTDTLLIKQQFHSDYEIMTLLGKRFAVASEVDPDATFDEQKVKKITGGDTLSGRLPYESHTEFQNKAKIIVLANHQPTVKRGGGSFWRRMRVIDFPNTVPEDKQNPYLLQELLEHEAPAIFAWIVEGAKKYYKHGLKTPEAVLVATKEYEESEDHINSFITSECEIGGGIHVTTDTDLLRGSYVDFCQREGFSPLEARKLGRELKKLGVDKTRVRVGGNRKYRYTNIRLKNDDSDGDIQW